eukprot:Gb_18883 [translate_table: standard]
MASDCDAFWGFSRIRPIPKPKNFSGQQRKPTMVDKFPNSVTGFVQSVAQNFLAPLTEISTKLGQAGNTLSSMSAVPAPVLFSNMPVYTFSVPQSYSLSSSESIDNAARTSSSMRNLAAGFPSNVRIDGIDSGVKRGPAFVGQVFSMCDPSGTGLMAVSSKIELPFLSSRGLAVSCETYTTDVTGTLRNLQALPLFLAVDKVKYIKPLQMMCIFTAYCCEDVMNVLIPQVAICE